MDKVKALLLPLALVFAAISIFEFGSRYGATNMRAYAIASELQFPLRIYVQAEANMDTISKETFGVLIDNGIAAGALHRQTWYLDKNARAALDQVLAFALSTRGEAAIERFDSIEDSSEIPGLDQAKLNEIRAAIREAKVELVDNAPAPAEEPAEPTVEAETTETDAAEPAAN